MRALPESGTTSKKISPFFFSLGEIGSEDGDANFGKKNMFRQFHRKILFGLISGRSVKKVTPVSESSKNVTIT